MVLVVVDVVLFFVEEFFYVWGILFNIDCFVGVVWVVGGIVCWVVLCIILLLLMRWEFYGERVVEMYVCFGGEGFVCECLWMGLDV